eukprot:11535461-Prorocentrum_lima.AAC.1
MATQGTFSSPHTVVALLFMDSLDIQTQLVHTMLCLWSPPLESKKQPAAGDGIRGRHRSPAMTGPPRAPRSSQRPWL